MKVLFLDIDGVVNCKTTTQRSRGFIGIDPYLAFLVGKIQLDTDCKVVLSSSWRHFPNGLEEVKAQVVDILDITPTLHRPSGVGVEYAERGKEIMAWIKENNARFVFNCLDEKNIDKVSGNGLVEKYAILDDESDFLWHQPLFKTSWDTGITPKIAKAVTDYLNDPHPMCLSCFKLMKQKGLSRHEWQCPECLPGLTLSIG